MMHYLQFNYRNTLGAFLYYLYNINKRLPFLDICMYGNAKGYTKLYVIAVSAKWTNYRKLLYKIIKSTHKIPTCRLMFSFRTLICNKTRDAF